MEINTIFRFSEVRFISWMYIVLNLKVGVGYVEHTRMLPLKWLAYTTGRDSREASNSGICEVLHLD